MEAEDLLKVFDEALVLAAIHLGMQKGELLGLARGIGGDLKRFSERQSPGETGIGIGGKCDIKRGIGRSYQD